MYLLWRYTTEHLNILFSEFGFSSSSWIWQNCTYTSQIIIFKRYLQFTQCYLFHLLSLHFLFAHIKLLLPSQLQIFNYMCSFLLIPFLLFIHIFLWVPISHTQRSSREKSFRKEERDKHQNKALVKTEKILLLVCLNSGNYRIFGGFFVHRLCQYLWILYLLYEGASLGDLRIYCFSPLEATLFCS